MTENTVEFKVSSPRIMKVKETIKLIDIKKSKSYDLYAKHKVYKVSLDNKHKQDLDLETIAD